MCKILHFVFPWWPLLAIISRPSSRFHVIFGLGNPRALQTNLADPPSGTIISPDVSSYTISGGITTSKKAVCIFIGSVLTWHMYWPRSSIFTLFIFNVHVLKSLCVTDNRPLLVMTCSWIAKIALASAFIHATYIIQKEHYFTGFSYHCKVI